MIGAKTLDLIFGSSFNAYLQKMNILIIGVGGIGCELLKNLSRYNFHSIHILDLDTIEVSNLNRQFIYRNHHVGQSKAHVAKEEITKLHPHMNIISHHQNVKDPAYGIRFFKNFDLVFMALDNQEARAYVNNICFMLNLPILEAGTTGHKGQAMLLKDGLSRCYDCYPKPLPKSYPVCTIRTLPEKPIHCVIWAKHLFGVLFGPKDDSNILVDVLELLSAHKSTEESARILFTEIFKKQINDQKTIEPEKFKHLRAVDLDDIIIQENINGLKAIETKVGSLESYISYFLEAFKQLFEYKTKSGPITFDKDYNLSVKFVTSASNIRSYVFGIPMQSDFDVKEMAGNIIPAISSTNAIAAAIQVSEAIKYFYNKYEEFLNNNANKNKLVMSNKELWIQNTNKTKIIQSSLGKSNPNCLICNPSLKPTILSMNFKNFTLNDLIINIINKEKELNDFNISYNNTYLYEKNDYLEDDEILIYQKNLDKTLEQIFSQPQFEIKITNQETDEKAKVILLDDSTISNKNYIFWHGRENLNFVSDEVFKRIIESHDKTMEEKKNQKLKEQVKSKDQGQAKKQSELPPTNIINLDSESEVEIDKVQTVTENKNKEAIMIISDDDSEDSDMMIIENPKMNNNKNIDSKEPKNNGKRHFIDLDPIIDVDDDQPEVYIQKKIKLD